MPRILHVLWSEKRKARPPINFLLPAWSVLECGQLEAECKTGQDTAGSGTYEYRTGIIRIRLVTTGMGHAGFGRRALLQAGAQPDNNRFHDLQILFAECVLIRAIKRQDRGYAGVSLDRTAKAERNASPCAASFRYPGSTKGLPFKIGL